MKITLFIGGLSGGGAERVICNLASFLQTNSHNVEILTMSDDEPSYPLHNSVTRVVLLKTDERKGFVYNTILRLFRLIKYILTRKNDAYVVMLPATTILLLSFKFLIKGKVIAAERVDPSTYSKKKQDKLRKLAYKAEGWIFQTQEQCNWYGDSVNKSKVSVIPNAINPDFILPYYTGTRNKSIVSAGRLTNQKNHKLLIDAFAKISDKYLDYNLIIYGVGPNLDNLKNSIKEYGLEDRILLPGFSKDIIENIAKSSLFVLSSDYEGMPNALMEAMALGVPSISTDCGGGGARFLIEDGKNGLLVPVKDVDALANAMDRVLSNQEFAESLGRESHKLCDTLAPDVIYGRWEKFIEEVIQIK